jgi:hypothetical protein
MFNVYCEFFWIINNFFHRYLYDGPPGRPGPRMWITDLS